MVPLLIVVHTKMAHVWTRKFYVLFICIAGIKDPSLAQVSDPNGAFNVTDCPLGPVIREVAPPDSFVQISWYLPMATSTLGLSIDSSTYPELIAGQYSGSNFQVDTTVTNTYRWVDANSNQATCTFLVRPQRPNIFTMITCPPANLMVYATTRVATWSTPPIPTPTSSAQGGVTLTDESHTSGSVFPVGDTTVLLTWRDDVGNFALCVFTVSAPAPNPCAVVVCQNGGYCTNGVCNCNNGYTGTFCEIAPNPCAGVVCQNGGYCTNGVCNCISGYTGVLCETTPNPCAVVVCQNGGYCTNGVCNCNNGYTGTFCETVPYPCAGVVCQNGGYCTNGVCNCNNGYTGTFCETAPNPCAGVVCQNGGYCTNGVCNCNNGYTGTFCETAPNTCAGVICQNDGYCTNGVCNCNNGYTGTFCETAPNPCAGVVCQNGGYCANGVCNCNNGYTGTFCETAPNPCAVVVCQNGGYCTNGVCNCVNGYTGTFCEISANPCAGVVCQNGGYCTNGVCNCISGYTGVLCETAEYSPISVTVESVLVTSITFSWSEATCHGTCPDGITGYSYRLLQTGTEAEIESGTTGANERMVTITGLMPCTEYSFSVAGISGSNTGNYSDAVFVTTAGEVSGLSIEPLSSSELKVSWETSTDSCKDLEYDVEYRLINRDQCQPLDTDDAEAVILSLSGTSITFPNLFSHSTYEIRVRNGDAETTMSATTKESEPSGAPTDITATTTNTTISLSWNQPPCMQRNGNITSYTYIFLKTGSSVPIFQDITTSDTSVIFNNLEVATEYSFIISANTKVGAGPQSFFQSQTLKEGGTSAQVNSGVVIVVGSVIGVIVIIVIVAVVIYRVRKSGEGPNDAPYEVNISASKSIEMSSRNPAYQRDNVQRASTDDNENPDPERLQYGHYEDLEKKGMTREQEYQDLDHGGKKMEVQQPGYQNVTITGKLLRPVEEFDFEVHEPARSLDYVKI